MKRILLTGPVERLEAWAEAVRSVGWEAIEFPLIGIEELGLRPEALFPASARFDWLCITSRSALPFVERLATYSPAIAAHAACVGEHATEHMRALGFDAPLEPARDALDLARLVLSRASAGSSVLWPRGDRAIDLGSALRDAGLVVAEPVVYASRALAMAAAPRADAIFFASPSACSAWVAAGVPGDAPPLAIAIGETTFEALVRHEPAAFGRVTRLAQPTPAALAFALAHSRD
ncbi:MAG: uroporphyrinogen-III synthase [Planctomycetota bacterium]|nr:uroporphyrinogen-III synthase [Planctomycetota bacterium]